MRDSWRTRVARQAYAVVSAMSEMLAVSTGLRSNVLVIRFIAAPEARGHTTTSGLDAAILSQGSNDRHNSSPGAGFSGRQEDRGARHCGDSLPPADEAEAFHCRRFDADTLSADTQDAADGLTHGL